MADFGEYPLSITRNGGVYDVAPSDQPIADECGINAEFDASRLDIMKARAASYGYILVEQEALEAPAQ